MASVGAFAARLLFTSCRVERTLVCSKHLFLNPDCSRGTRPFPSAQCRTFSRRIFSKILECVAKRETSLVWSHRGTPVLSLFNVTIFAVFRTPAYLHAFSQLLKQLTKHSMQIGARNLIVWLDTWSCPDDFFPFIFLIIAVTSLVEVSSSSVPTVPSRRGLTKKAEE